MEPRKAYSLTFFFRVVSVVGLTLACDVFDGFNTFFFCLFLEPSHAATATIGVQQVSGLLPINDELSIPPEA